MQNRKYDLEDRLVNYTCRMIDVVESLPNSRSGNYIAGQLIPILSFTNIQLWRGSGY